MWYDSDPFVTPKISVICPLNAVIASTTTCMSLGGGDFVSPLPICLVMALAGVSVAAMFTTATVSVWRGEWCVLSNH
jgi:hypothetical protein